MEKLFRFSGACSLGAAGLIASAVALQAVPKNIVISLDGATPRLVDRYMTSGVISSNEGLGLIRSKGFHANLNETVSPSLTAVGHIAIATGSRAAKNDVIANTFHLVASPFTFNVSGFGAPIGGYDISGPGETANPTAEPIWLGLGLAGKKAVTATWPGADGVDVRIPGLVDSPILQLASERTVSYTVPFGAATAPFQKGLNLTAANFGPVPTSTTDQLIAAGHVSFSPVRHVNLESFNSGGVSYNINVAALDTTDDNIVNYDTLVIFNSTEGIQPGPFALPSTGPAYIRPGAKISALFYLEGHANKGGVRYFVSALAPDLSTVRLARTSVSFIPRNPAVLADVDDINNNIGFWQPQPDFRLIEKIDATPSTFTSFPDLELERIYEELVREWTDYQTRVALHAITKNPDADLIMIYFEQPDGSGHQFLLEDSRQPTDPRNPNSIGSGQDAAKVARYASYVETAYAVANHAVQRVVEAVGVDANGIPRSNIFVVSDHGFEIFHTAVNLNGLLAANGVPSTKVRAVTSGPAANIYINLQGRELNGTVTPAEYRALQMQVASILSSYLEVNSIYTLGAAGVPLFDKVYTRAVPAADDDPSFGRGTSEFIGQDSGDVYALLTVGYNFDGIQTPVVGRLGDSADVSAVLSLPNFYGAHGYDPTLPHMSAIFFAAGPNIGTGTLSKVSNVDVAPTLNDLLGVNDYFQVDGRALPIQPLAFVHAASRLVHGNAGAFDLPLQVDGTLGSEGRNPGDSPLRIVLQFNKELESAAFSSQSVQVSGSEAIVTLHQKPRNGQVLLLAGRVTDIYGASLPVQLRIAFLRGDVNGDGAVNGDDLKLVQDHSGPGTGVPIDGVNFRYDINLNGFVNQADIAQTKSRLGDTLE